MNGTTTPTAIMAPYRWARTEDVLVTLVRMDPDGATSTFLIQRLFPAVDYRYAAFVVEFVETDILVNGLSVASDYGWSMALCALADAVALAPSPKPGDSATTRTA